jgi:ring-1,2-phenylacetyl-CoA epoxidase subunit PaaE
MGYQLELISFVIIPLIMTLFVIVLFFDYIPHHPHKSQDRYHNTRIFPGKLMNILLLGQNYHLIHHMYPRLPWYKYQEVYHKILPDLEANGAPIEDVFGGIRPGFLKSPNTKNLQNGGTSINMLLKVCGIERSTNNSVTVRFALPEGEILQYQAGQYITVSKWLANEQQTRCYSLCTAPSEGLLEIGVKATPNGLVSGFLNHDLNIDDELIVQGPFGDFTYPPQHDHEIRDLVLIAGGSGITPILSILKTALREASSKTIHLIYASRSKKSTIFYDQINTLHSNNPERFKLTYVFGEGLPSANVRIGKLNLAIIESALPMLSSATDSSDTEFYICGPEGLKKVATEVLESKEIELDRRHVEQFVSQVTAPIGITHTVKISLADGQRHILKVASNQTVLEVAKAEGMMIPHACGNGTCGTCKCKVAHGKVNEISDTIPGITEHEKASGYTLACQCKPLESISLLEVQS